MSMKDLIRPMDFCEIVTDKFVDQGVKRGHLVFVASLKALPISEEDPYTQRVKAFVHLVVDDHVIIPDIYAMDPTSLARVSPVKQRNLSNILKQDFANEEPINVVNDNATIN